MEKRQQPREMGAPAWMVTFGDMMSLLLCFFVILVALSEVQEDKFEMLVNSLRRGFAYEHSTGHRDSADYNDVFQRLAALLAKDTGAQRPRGVRVQSLAGNSFQVTSVKKGERLMINGDVSIDFGRAELKPQCKKVLDQVAELISGYPNRIEIVGYASAQDNVDDPYQLSWDRARAALEYLVYRGVKRERIMAVGAGIGSAAAGALEDPQRIDITVTEEVVKDS